MLKLPPFLVLFAFMLLNYTVVSQSDGTLVEKTEITNDSLLSLFSAFKNQERFVKRENGVMEWSEAWSQMKDMVMYRITYMSDGLKVTGYLFEPKASGKYPCILFNRGGNRDFGMMDPAKLVFWGRELVMSGYVVIASNYRGVDGGEGMEEFGGHDVHDVLNLIPLLESNPKADIDAIGLFGWSRGGMMSFLALLESDRFKAMVVGGALTDLRNEQRPEMETNVYAELIPAYWKNKKAALDQRSAVTWADRLPKNVPILMMHGTADWRVTPESALSMAQKLQEFKVPYRLVMLEGGDHGLSEFREETQQMTLEWFDRYLKNKEPLPDLEPHGR